MIKFSLKNKSLLICAVFLLILFLLGFFVARPAIEQIKNNSAQLVSQREAVETFFQNWQTLKKSGQEVEKIKQDMESQYPLLTRQEAVKFIMDLEKIAQATKNSHEITVTSESQTAGQGKAAKNQNLTDFINFQITLAGNFSGLMKFLLYFENTPYFSQIKSLNITRATTGSQTANSAPINAGDIKTTINIATPVQ